MRSAFKIALISIVVVAVLAIGGGLVFLYFGTPSSSTPGGASTAASATPTKSPSAARTESDEDFTSVQIYSVLADGSLDPQPTGLAATVWHTFTRVTTPQVAGRMMTEFRAGDAPTSDTLAYVYASTDPTRWILAANLATSDDPTQLIATLVHEYGHILTLGVDEVDPASNSCATLVLDEGCAARDSAIATFQSQFWAPYGDTAPDAANDDSNVGEAFYQAHEEDFVSDYAATNVVEDVAESFMTYVLQDHASGASISAQKLRFFENYPKFVAERERIRTEFASDLGLAN
jgi:hypothetical protein